MPHPERRALDTKASLCSWGWSCGFQLHQALEIRCCSWGEKAGNLTAGVAPGEGSKQLHQVLLLALKESGTALSCRFNLLSKLKFVNVNDSR